MNEFKCPNCGENSMLIVKTYKMTNSENYIKCGRCLHVWMQRKKQIKDFIVNLVLTVFGSLCFGVLIFAYMEKLWTIYVLAVLMIGIVGLTNYIVHKKPGQ